MPRFNRLCAVLPLALSVILCVWVLGNVAGGARHGDPEGIGFHIFWLLILAQLFFMAAYLLTADWSQGRAVTYRIVMQAAGLALAFAPVAYFRL
jgi:hypothetical protein